MRFGKNSKAAAILIAVLMIGAVMAFTAGCRVNVNINDTSAEKSQTEEQEKTAEKELQSVTAPEDFDPTGEYQDKTSQRADMTITPIGEEGHYAVLVSWGSSAFETTIWEFDGEFDHKSGMLTYNNCTRIELTRNDEGKQEEEVVYEDGKGALLYYDGGFNWDNKKDDTGKDCYFVRYDDLSDTIIEESEESEE